MKPKAQGQESSKSVFENLNTNVINQLTQSSTLILTLENDKPQLVYDEHSSIHQTPSLLKNCSSLSLSESTFPLIKNVSGESVSLESIPTRTLFKPNAEKKFLLEQKDSVTIDLHDSKQGPSTAIIATDKLPQSIVFFIKNQQKYKKKNSEHNLCDKNKSSISVSNAEYSDDTDTENTDSVSELEDKPPSAKTLYSLQSSDTVILDPDQSTPSSKNNMTYADTIILETIPDQTLTSLPSMPSALDTFTSGAKNSFTLDACQIFSLPNSINLPGADDALKKTLYLMSNDGHLTPLNLISDPPLFTFMNQTGLTKHSVVKATQTELVFGTGNLFFRQIDTSNNESLSSNDKDQTFELPRVQTIFDSLDDTSYNIKKDQVCSEIKKCVNSGNGENAEITEGVVVLGKSFNNVNLENSHSSASATSNILNQNVPTCDNVGRNNVPVFKCIECKKEFSCKQDFNKHDKTHTKVFQCDLCNAKFTRLGNFTRHRKIHNLQPEGQPLFQCETCKREFLQRCDLKRHQLIHSKQEPHRCDKCGKGYIRKSDLVVHLRFHNKEKAFKCNMCDKKFFQTGDLSRHVRRTHKPNSQLTCGHCDRKYACETTLIRHMKAVHKDIIVQTVNQKLKEIK